MFSVPVVFCYAEWIAKCQFTRRRVHTATAFGFRGAIVCEPPGSYRFVPASGVLDWDESYDDELYVGPGPWIELHANGAVAHLHEDSLEGWIYDPDFIGKCYRVHSAVRRLQRRWRARAFEKVARLLPIDEAVASMISMYMCR